MRNLGPVSLCLAFAAASLAAQDSGSQPTPAIQQALDRIAKDSWGQGAQSNWARSIVPAVQPILPLALPPDRVCSAPLLEMHVDKPQWFTMQQVTPPTTGDRMPIAIAPAPACSK